MSWARLSGGKLAEGKNQVAICVSLVLGHGKGSVTS